MPNPKRLSLFAALSLLTLTIASCKVRSIQDSRPDFFEGKNPSSSSVSSSFSSRLSSDSISLSSDSVITVSSDVVASSSFSTSSATSSENTSSSSSVSSSSASSSSSTSSSTSASSSSSAPISSSRSSSSSTPIHSSSKPSLDIDAHYRIAPVQASGDTLNVYNLDGTIQKTLKKSSVEDSSTWYVDYQDVALYYLGYGELPANYTYFDQTSSATETSSKRNAYNTFGKKARLYTKDYYRSDGYATAFKTPNEYHYFEADFDVDGTYASRSTWNRGTGRLVILYKGLKQYGTTPTIFYTDDHYKSFRECYNYGQFSKTQVGDGGFGPIFDGTGSGYGTYVAPTTITL